MIQDLQQVEDEEIKEKASTQHSPFSVLSDSVEAWEKTPGWQNSVRQDAEGICQAMEISSL